MKVKLQLILAKHEKESNFTATNNNIGRNSIG